MSNEQKNDLSDYGDKIKQVWRADEHGFTCPKVAHVGSGHLHALDNDMPYDVDGCMYCGRCHEAL